VTNAAPLNSTAQVVVERWVEGSKEFCPYPNDPTWCVDTHQLGSAEPGGTNFRVETRHIDGFYYDTTNIFTVVPNQATDFSGLNARNTSGVAAVFGDRFVSPSIEGCFSPTPGYYPTYGNWCWTGFEHNGPPATGAWYRWVVKHPNGTASYSSFIYMAP